MEYVLTVLGVAHSSSFLDHPIEPAFVAGPAFSSNVVDDSQPGKFTPLDGCMIE